MQGERGRVSGSRPRGAWRWGVALALVALPAAAQPVFTSTSPNLRAAVGSPYVYGPGRAARASGSAPLTYETCGAPAGFHVDALSGAVRWTPEAAGVYSVCLRATDPLGSDVQAFTVTVLERAPSPPTAQLAATPTAGAAPLTTTLDASGSKASVSEALPLVVRFDVGDGSPTRSAGSVQPTYRVPGGYLARLEVWDAYGGHADAWAPLRVKDASGRVPPTARIKASGLQGADALDVDLSCDCAKGDADLVAYRWELGDGSVSGEAAARVHFGPGRHHVRLTVVDANGLAASDEVEVVVRAGSREPPECSARALPAPSDVSTPLPLDVVWTADAVAPAGTVAKVQWTLGDGTTALGRSVTTHHGAPGWYEAEVRVEDDAGLACTDRTAVVVPDTQGGVPPRIVTEPAPAARCGVAYAYAPQALGSGPLTWSAPAAPQGLTVDAARGTVSWQPVPALRGTQQVTLQAQGPAGVAAQTFSVTVECPSELSFRTEGGCAAAPGGLASGALLVLATWLRRRRRRGLRRPGGARPCAGRRAGARGSAGCRG